MGLCEHEATQRALVKKQLLYSAVNPFGRGGRATRSDPTFEHVSDKPVG